MYDNNNISSGLNPHSEQEVPQCQTTNESEAASFDNKLEETGSEYIVSCCCSSLLQVLLRIL